MVYTCSFLYDDMDVDGDYVKDIIPLEVSYIDEIKVYTIQILCWSLFWGI